MESNSSGGSKSLLGDISNKDLFRVPAIPINGSQKNEEKKHSKAELIERNKIKMLRRLENRRIRQSGNENKASSTDVDLKATEESFIHLDIPEPLKESNDFVCGPAIEFSNISAIHGQTFRSSIEPTKISFMTSTPSRPRRDIFPIQGSPSILNQSVQAIETIDERQLRQMEALTVWCNMMLKTTSEFDELDLGKTKKEASKKLQELLNGRPVLATKELQKKTYKDFLRTQERVLLRQRSSESFKATEAFSAITEIVMKDGLSIRENISVYSEIDLKERLLHIFLSFHPAWLHLGLETVFNEEIQIPEGFTWTSILSHFISTRVFSNPAILVNKKFAYGDVRKIVTPAGRIALHRHFLIYLSSFLYAVEFLKSSGLIKHDPPLFSRSSKFLCLDDVFSALSKSCLSGGGMSLGKMFSSKLGFKPSYKQGFLDNYDYTVQGFSSLLDGIILGKLVEITTGAKSGKIMCKLRNPGGDRLRKIGNVNTVLKEANLMNLVIDDVKAEEVVGGNKATILGLLWKIIGVYILESETDCLRRESIILRNRGTLKQDEDCCAQTPEEVVLRICTQIGDFAGLKIRSTADLKDGQIFAFAWRMYNPDAPDVNFYNGKTLFDKVVEASSIELDVPIGLSGSVVLFANLYLSRLFNQKKMQDAARRIQRAYRGYRCLKMMRVILESHRYTAGRDSISSLCSLQKTHVIEKRQELPVVSEDVLYNTLFESCDSSTFIGGDDENQAIQTLLLLGSSTCNTSSSVEIINATRSRAASTIQALFRGYRCRKMYKSLLLQRKNHCLAAITIQAAVRNFLARKMVAKIRKDLIRQNGAAITIQAAVRGFLARKMVMRIRGDSMRQDGAAIAIQAVVRGFLARKMVTRIRAGLMRQDGAAIAIQAVVRGFLARKMVTSIRTGLMRRVAAASKIQAVFRGFVARRLYANKRKAAVIIQCQFRGYLCRKALIISQQQAVLHDKDVTKIQSCDSTNQLNQKKQSPEMVIDGTLLTSETGSSLFNEAILHSTADESQCNEAVLSVRHIYEEIQRERRLLKHYKQVLKGVKKSELEHHGYECEAAATIIQKWYRGCRSRRQYPEICEYLKQCSDDYAKRIQEEAANDSENLLTNRLTPAVERLIRASNQLFVNNVYGIKVAAFAINRLTDLCTEVLIKFVCDLNGFGTLLDRLEACDRGPALVEIASIVMLTLRRVVESSCKDIESHVLKYGEDCVRILLHCILAYYNNSCMVENIGYSLLALHRHEVLKDAFKKAPFYVKELSKKFVKLPKTDVRVQILMKLKLKFNIV